MEFGYKLSPSDWAILFRSWMHTHTELKFSHRYNGISFSSTLKDDYNGCRFKKILYSHPERWDSVIVPVTCAEEDTLYAECDKLVGMKYDLKFVSLGFLSKYKLIKPAKNRRWCTRAVAGPLKVIHPDIPFNLELLTPSWFDMMVRWYYGEKYKGQIIEIKE